VLKVHWAVHPGPVGDNGTRVLAAGVSGVPLSSHELGWGPVPKSTLCMLTPVGYENDTVPPVAIVTLVPPVDASNL
jgi:hypothetical protein